MAWEDAHIDNDICLATNGPMHFVVFDGAKRHFWMAAGELPIPANAFIGFSLPSLLGEEDAEAVETDCSSADAALDDQLVIAQNDINNAQLLSVSTYHDWVPAFLALYRDSAGDLPRFYTRVEHLGGLQPASRRACLEQWSQGWQVDPVCG